MNWMNVSSALLLLALGAYVVASALYPAYLVLRRDGLGLRAGRALALGGVLHLLAIGAKALALRHAPFAGAVEAL